LERRTAQLERELRETHKLCSEMLGRETQNRDNSLNSGASARASRPCRTRSPRRKPASPGCT
jgi:hypothetical protein